MVSLLELTWGDGWGESAYVSLDWDRIPKGYPEPELIFDEGEKVAGVWHCRPPAVSSFIAKTQSGLFKLSWFTANPESQWFRQSHHVIYCYSYNLLERNIGFVIFGAPTPRNWSPKKGAAIVRNAKNPFLNGKVQKVKWVRLRP